MAERPHGRFSVKCTNGPSYGLTLPETRRTVFAVVSRPLAAWPWPISEAASRPIRPWCRALAKAAPPSPRVAMTPVFTVLQGTCTKAVFSCAHAVFALQLAQSSRAPVFG
jgi:hypothetical protein